MITYINTEDIQDVLKQARALETELREEINGLYDRLAKVPTETGEWVGEKANYYFGIIAQDKAPLDAFCDTLVKENNYLENILGEAESAING